MDGSRSSATSARTCLETRVIARQTFVFRLQAQSKWQMISLKFSYHPLVERHSVVVGNAVVIDDSADLAGQFQELERASRLVHHDLELIKWVWQKRMLDTEKMFLARLVVSLVENLGAQNPGRERSVLDVASRGFKYIYD